MLEEISVRQQKLGLSTRKFAEQLDVSPTLLSLVLNKKRAISGDLTVRIRRWFNTLALTPPNLLSSSTFTTRKFWSSKSPPTLTALRDSVPSTDAILTV